MKSKRNKKEPLIIHVLQWASDRGSAGFTIDELKKVIENNEGDYKWVQTMMMGQINGDPPLIYYLVNEINSTGRQRYYITASGAAVLMDYLELNEARESAKEARCYAIIAIIISVVVGAIQIYKIQDVEIVRPVELKDAFIKTEVTNFPATQNVNINNDFLKTEIIKRSN